MERTTNSSHTAPMDIAKQLEITRKQRLRAEKMRQHLGALEARKRFRMLESLRPSQVKIKQDDLFLLYSVALQCGQKVMERVAAELAQEPNAFDYDTQMPQPHSNPNSKPQLRVVRNAPRSATPDIASRRTSYLTRQARSWSVLSVPPRRSKSSPHAQTKGEIMPDSSSFRSRLDALKSTRKRASQIRRVESTKYFNPLAHSSVNPTSSPMTQTLDLARSLPLTQEFYVARLEREDATSVRSPAIRHASDGTQMSDYKYGVDFQVNESPVNEAQSSALPDGCESPQSPTSAQPDGFESAQLPTSALPDGFESPQSPTSAQPAGFESPAQSPTSAQPDALDDILTTNGQAQRVTDNQALCDSGADSEHGVSRLQQLVLRARMHSDNVSKTLARLSPRNSDRTSD